MLLVNNSSLLLTTFIPNWHQFIINLILNTLYSVVNLHLGDKEPYRLILNNSYSYHSWSVVNQVFFVTVLKLAHYFFTVFAPLMFDLLHLLSQTKIKLLLPYKKE